MSDDLEGILLTKVPDFVGEWELKSTTPCGHLIDQVAKYPSDPSRVVILTKGQHNARKIAAALDNYKLFGSVIQAWYALTKPAEPSSAANCNTVDADCSKNHEIQAETHGISSEKTHEKHTSQNSQIAQPTNIAHDNWNQQDRKRRSSATVDSTETFEHARRRRDETGGSRSKISSRKSPSSEDSRGQKVLPDSRQNEDSFRRSRLCRFCCGSGHVTWDCKKMAEYYQVNLTIGGKNPQGYQWPASSIVKVEGLYAGPIIEYFETHHLHKDKKMNGEEIRIMFAWLTNYNVCHTCGAAGHMDNDGLCKYLNLTLKHPETEEMLAHVRRPFCRRMRGIRDKLSFGELQQYAYAANQKFRGWMESSDRRPLKYSEKMHEEHSEKPHRGTLEEPKRTEKHNPPVEPGPIVFSAPDGQRIKIEPYDEY